MNIQIVRLNSGEEVLGDVEEKENSVLIKKPALILPTGQGSIGLMPWMPYIDAANGIEIKTSFVAFMVKPHDELMNEYSTAFGSGLVVPTKGTVSGPALTLTE